jgi:hypothetical protein
VHGIPRITEIFLSDASLRAHEYRLRKLRFFERLKLREVKGIKVTEEKLKFES